MAVPRRMHDQITTGRVKKTGKNPTDRGKQGVKRSLLTDGKGLPLSVVVTGANTHDVRLVEETQASLQTGRPGIRLRLCLDKGYDAEWLREMLKNQRYIPFIQSRGDEREAARQEEGFKARRWVVERTHSWMNRFRRILVRWEKKLRTMKRCCIYAVG